MKAKQSWWLKRLYCSFSCTRRKVNSTLPKQVFGYLCWDQHGTNLAKEVNLERVMVTQWSRFCLLLFQPSCLGDLFEHLDIIFALIFEKQYNSYVYHGWSKKSPLARMGCWTNCWLIRLHNIRQQLDLQGPRFCGRIPLLRQTVTSILLKNLRFSWNVKQVFCVFQGNMILTVTQMLQAL